MVHEQDSIARGGCIEAALGEEHCELRGLTTAIVAATYVVTRPVTGRLTPCPHTQQTFVSRAVARVPRSWHWIAATNEFSIFIKAAYPELLLGRVIVILDRIRDTVAYSAFMYPWGTGGVAARNRSMVQGAPRQGVNRWIASIHWSAIRLVNDVGQGWCAELGSSPAVARDGCEREQTAEHPRTNEDRASYIVRCAPVVRSVRDRLHLRAGSQGTDRWCWRDSRRSFGRG
jgi:hypothetical protein